MSLILVAGIPESGKDTLLEMVLEGSRKNLPPFRLLKFDDLISYDVNKESKELDMWSFSERTKQIKNIQSGFHKKLRSSIDMLDRTEKNIIVDGYFTFRTHEGFVPLLYSQSARSFYPDMIIIAELGLKSPELLRKLGRERVRQLRYHQDINLNYATNYSSLTRSPINIVRIEYGNVKEALRDMTDLITLALK
jgi:adenylate kinase